MKKQIILAGVIFLVCNLVYAIYGGESEVIYHFDKCSELVVNVTGKLIIENGEYTFENCSIINESINNNSWKCNCYDGFDLIIKTNIRTINEYNITAVCTYKEVISDSKSIVSPSSGGHSSLLICGDWSECVDGLQEQICNRGLVTKKNIRSCAIEEETNVEENEESSPIINDTSSLNTSMNDQIDNQNGLMGITGAVIGSRAGKVGIGTFVVLILAFTSLLLIRKFKRYA